MKRSLCTTAYAGFTFDPTGTLPLYGWLQLNFDASGADFTVGQWAFDNAGALIAVGSVPEPTTAVLLGLGLMSLAAMSRLGFRPGRVTVGAGERD